MLAEDVSAAAHFYRNVIGLPSWRNTPAIAPLHNLDGTYLVILRDQPTLPLNPELRFPLVAFSNPDLDANLDKLRSHGVALPWGVETYVVER